MIKYGYNKMLHLGPKPQQYEYRISLSSSKHKADFEILFEKP